jgi:hypothetical protein
LFSDCWIGRAEWETAQAQYIHDNTDDEFTHQNFLNAYLASKGAATISLEQFRTLPGSQATGSSGKQRITNLTQLTVDTSWWIRYRDDSHNPDLDPNFTFPQAVPTLFTGEHTAIPRTDADTKDPNFLQAIANTAGFHFATIEQGGSSLYPAMAQRATSVEVLRILISIGPTETMHFQTWSDTAGDAPPLSAVDPVTHVPVTFPDLNSPPFGGEEFQTNLIMPEPCPFLSRKLPVCSIIRPTETNGIAMNVVNFLTSMGLFIGQSPAFFKLLRDLAEDADAARRGLLSWFAYRRPLGFGKIKAAVRSALATALSFLIHAPRDVEANCSEGIGTDFEVLLGIRRFASLWTWVRDVA